jgi:phospholipid-binding lipoprotein MlaA
MRGAIAPILAAFAFAVSAAALGGCAAPTTEALAANDPFEAENRAIYRLDQRFDKYVVLPVAWVYVYYLPAPIHRSLHNFVLNLDLPVTFANDVLQGDADRAATALGRFAMNSTLGLGGVVDLARQAGLDYRAADFGQTLGRWGVPEGPFLVLPIIGPDPPRDLVGDVADLSLDPFLYLPPAEPFYGRVLSAVTLRIVSPFEEHARNIVLRNELARGSLDPYFTMRGIYRQLRADEIGEGLPDVENPDAK